MFQFIRATIQTIRRRLYLRSLRVATYRTARDFNRANTFSWTRPRWMCPHCLRIHVGRTTSPFTGVNFPACCGIEVGHRLDCKRHATVVSQ